MGRRENDGTLRIMEAGEALSTAAQLALALAGFAGVVVVFRSGPLHQWRSLDKVRLQILLTNSILPLALCLVALLLLTIKPPPPWIWRACSGLAVAFVLLVAPIMSKSVRAVPQDEFKGRSKFLFYFLSILGIAILLLQVYNLIALNVFWAFFAVIIVQLLTGAVQFVRLILLPEH